MKEKKGRRTFSKGVWAPGERIAAVKAEFEAERSTDEYAKRKASAARRREMQQVQYVEEFEEAVLSFLNFDDRYEALARQLSKAVTKHATPVGSGTVARTKRIPIERRAASAAIAWMRHQTTAYDDMVIPRVRGKRREVRRMLAEKSHALLRKYRNGDSIESNECPLARALAGGGLGDES
jgi:hypothetical protein